MERRPLHHVTPTEMYIRVTAALIKRDYRIRPKAYAPFPANEIERLASEMQHVGCGPLAPWLKAAARHVAGGMPLREWEQSMPWDWSRSVFKQRWQRKR